MRVSFWMALELKRLSTNLAVFDRLIRINLAGINAGTGILCC